MQQQQEMQQQQQQAQQQAAETQRQYEMAEADKERANDITVAEIKSAGYGAMQDINENKESDFQDALVDIRQRTEHRENMNLKREQMISQTSNDQSKLAVEKEKLATQRQIADKNLAIARENKNKYDIEASGNKSKKKDK